VDREENPVYMALAETMEERAKRYREGIRKPLDGEKLSGVRKSLGGITHYVSERFEKELEERLVLRKKRGRGRPAKGEKKGRGN
jgi:hypothetical protein